MTFPLASRRAFIRASIAAASAPLALLAPTAQAQTGNWPSKPVRIVVPYAPGGLSDAVARLLAERLALGQPVIVDNKPGGGGVIGMGVVAKAAADGHTLAFSAISPLTLSPHTHRVPYDALTDFAPVARVMVSPVYLLATPAFTGKTFADAIAQARAQPDQVSFATSGVGSLGHLMLEQISRKAQVRFNHVPYKGGGQIATDAAGGQFQLFTANPGAALNALVERGKLRVLAVAAPGRMPGLPDVPTIDELGHPEANMNSVFGVFAPARTPPEVIQRLHEAINRVLAERDVQERLRQLDYLVSPATIAAFTDQLRREHAANGRLLKESGIRLE